MAWGNCAQTSGPWPDRASTRADGGQQLVRCFAGKHKAHIAWRFFQCFEQRIGRDVVHLLGGINKYRLAPTASAGALGKFDRIAHGLDTDFPAGLARLVVNFGLCFFRQGPAQGQHVHFRHQHAQIGMRMHVDGVAASALTAGALGRWRLTQPGAYQLQA